MRAPRRAEGLMKCTSEEVTVMGKLSNRKRDTRGPPSAYSMRAETERTVQ